MRETSVGVHELKTQLSKYLRQVKAGNTIVITDHGRMVGRIVPTEASLDEKLAALQQAGLIHWNGRKLEDMQPLATMPEGCSLSDLIIEERR